MRKLFKNKKQRPAKWLLGASCMAVLLGAGCALTQNAVQTQAPATQSGFAHEQSDLPVDEAVLFGTLPNGMRYAIMPHAEPPGRVSIRLLVQAGSLMETQSELGLAHFLEHMAFNGTTHYPPGELVDYLQRMGLGFGADTNAHTGFNETVYKLDMPHSDAATLETGLVIMRDYADGLLLVQEEIDRERGVILSEKRDRDTVDYRSWIANWEFLFPQSLLSSRSPIGEAEVISNATRQDFVDFYSAWYRPERITLVVVGDIDAQAVQTQVEQLFESFEASAPARPEPDLGLLTTPGLATGNYFEAEATATEVSLVNITADEDSPDSIAVRERVIREVAVNRMLNRRLERLGEQPDAPFTQGAFYRTSYLDFFSMRGVDMNCRADQWEAALGVAEQTLRQALEYGFDATEVEEARAELLRAATTNLREQNTRKSADISDVLVRNLSSKDVFVSPQTAFEITGTALDGFTPEAALATLQRMWADPNRWVFVSGNARIEEPQATIRESYLLAAAAPVEAPQAREAGVWTYTDFGTASVVAEQSTFEPLQVEQIRFANNARLNFKHTDFQKGKVLVNVSIAGGMLALPQEQPALATWAELALLRGGLGQLGWNQVQSIFAGREVSVSFDVESDSFVFSGATNAEDLQAQLQLLAAYVTDAGYRAEGAQAARREFEQMSLAASNTLMGAMRNEGNRFFAGGSYRFGLPSKAAFDAESLEGVRAWLADALATGYLEVSVVGDVDLESVQQAVASTFGALPERALASPGFTAARESITFPAGVAEKTFYYASEEARALAFVAWPTVDMSDIRLTRRLSLLSNVMADRLRMEIRQKLGEGYSPYAFNRSSDTYKGFGYFAALNMISPSSSQEIGELIRTIGGQIAEGPISDDEFKRALEPTLSYINEYRRNNGYWLNTVLSNSQAEPYRLQWAQNFESDFLSITVAELQALAAEYLQPERATILRILPRVDSASAQ